MNIHQNARLTPLGRERMVRAIVEGGQSSTLFTRSHGSSLHRLAAQSPRSICSRKRRGSEHIRQANPRDSRRRLSDKFQLLHVRSLTFAHLTPCIRRRTAKRLMS
jgi:hypothetical protein